MALIVKYGGTTTFADSNINLVSQIPRFEGPALPVITSGLVMYVDAAYTASYTASNPTIWEDLTGNEINFKLNRTGTGEVLPFYTSSNGTLPGNSGSIFFTRGTTAVSGGFATASVYASSLLSAITESVTLSTWFKTSTALVAIITGMGYQSTEATINQTYQIYQNGANVLGRITTGGAGGLTDISTTFTTNTWTNIAVTYNGATMSLYKNGALVSSTPKTGSMITSFPFMIGGQWQNNPTIYFGASDVFTGNIANVAVYNRALSLAEITQNYNSQRPYLGI